MRVCDLHKLKTVIRVALRFIKDGERYESASCSFILLFSADGTGLKWSWWRSLLRLASSQSCQGNRPPDVAGDLGARRWHAEWRCPVNNHWLSHFKPCRWSGSEAGVKPTLLAVRINVLNNNTIAECHHFFKTLLFWGCDIWKPWLQRHSFKGPYSQRDVETEYLFFYEMSPFLKPKQRKISH